MRTTKSNKQEDMKQTAGLIFSDEGHRYLLDGLSIPSVTQVIKAAGLQNFDFVPEEVLQRAADLGNKVHKTTELYDLDQLVEETLHPVLKSYLESWKKFRSDFQFEPLEIESMYYHPIYRYAGRLDRVGYITERVGNTTKKYLSIVDIKSGVKDKTHALQTAAYAELFNHGKKIREQVKKRYSIYLSPDTYKLESHDSPKDLKIFLAALTITNYKGDLK